MKKFKSLIFLITLGMVPVIPAQPDVQKSEAWLKNNLTFTYEYTKIRKKNEKNTCNTTIDINPNCNG